ncbi:haloacid dehalogenase type II [Hymenobacter taeanensis]|uniref:Haloacid dehalogenase type II n=1 Tax=Hymenobacter taeanensis TaxID=2735321 RepID=A0A6M6BFD3_9BACT|nr:MULTISPECIES: haloacid dehalogenase type II [Hymenobacter]QJX46652.1 haloacid dehalogenase type II [Hymenobacter taeanensis]UOQ80515.1 haloacid dehalogenase type II [Hymenobacter sp. 5414T-23]
MPKPSPSLPQPRVLLLDVNETLLDMSPLKLAVGKAFGEKRAFNQWFGLLLQYSLVDTVTTTFHPFSLIADAALDMAADMLKKKRLRPAQKKKLLALMTRLPAHSDVPKGLQMLLDAGFSLVAFSNSTQLMLDEQLRQADIIHYFDRGLSVDAVQLYKPHPHTYQAAVQALGVAPADAALLAAHGWDVAGALRAGLQAGFVARPGQTLYPLAPRPTYMGETLVEVARQLIG